MYRHASLNRIYRLVWSRVHQAWVIASEVTRGQGKAARSKLLLASVVFATTNLAQAGPTGGQVTAGSGSINQSGNTTTITQNSQNLSVNWQSFNTSAQETVNFVQPSASAIAVNRIIDTNATQFFGRLNANGQVYLINPNGVLFGAGSQINVGGLVASTLDLNDASLASDKRTFSGSGKGSVVNQGSITTAQGGYVAFIANTVSNQGSINAAGGSVALGAGSAVTLSFAGNALLGMQINQSTLDNLAGNGGLINADGGMVLMSAGARDAVLASVVNNTGIIQARSVQDVNGTIVLEGGGHSVVANSGTLDASGKNAGEAGGTVKVLGDDVTLAAASRVDVSGDSGGGVAYIGGNFLGQGSEKNAQSTTVAAGSVINADAISRGNGGKVAVWSDKTTQFNGSISARGGAISGNGGEVETSGKLLNINSSASVNTAAPKGVAGNWLLDPDDITIGNVSLWGSNYGINVDTRVLTNALNSGNVTIKTTSSAANCGNLPCSGSSSGNGDIVILDTIGEVADGSNGIPLQWIRGDSTLTLSAYRDIRFKATDNVALPGYFDSTIGGAIWVSAGGRVVLKADNTGTGSGTVRFDRADYNNILFFDSAGGVDIFYNPDNYDTPTNYAPYVQTLMSGQLKTYMAVNINANVADKTYDGTNAATIVGGVTSKSGLPSGISLQTGSANATFVDQNAGSNKSVIISGVTFNGGNTIVNYSGQNYYINGLDSKTATINKANLVLEGSKVYDGTTTVAGSTLIANGANGQTFSVTGAGDLSNLSNKNVQTNSALSSVTGLSLGSSANGGLASNYNVLSSSSSKYTVTPKALTLSGISASDKVYDATTSATLNTSNVSYSGLITGDAVGLAGTGYGVFAIKDVGTHAITVSGYTLSGPNAGNYVVTQPTGITATISKADLVVTGITAIDKTYDAMTNAILSGTASVSALGSDSVSVLGVGTASFANADAGISKGVIVSGFTLGGTDAGNYNVVQPTNVSATINKADLVLSGSKVYDGSKAVTGSTLTATGVAGQTFTVTGSGDESNLSSKNVQNGSALNSTTGLSLGSSANGGLSSNYNVLSSTGSSYTVTQKALTINGVTADNKVYDGTTSASLNTSNVSYSGVISGDNVQMSGSGYGFFANKDVGTHAVAVSGYTLGGTDAGNYLITPSSGVTATISKADLVVNGLSASNKTYDAGTAATLNGTASVTAIGGDLVILLGFGVGHFGNADAGTNKQVLLSGYTLGGTDGGNYNLVAPANLTATIHKADLVLGGSKVYDGSTTVAGSTLTATGVAGQTFTVTGSGDTSNLASKNVQSGSALSSTTGLSVGTSTNGGLASNYNLLSTTGSSYAVTPASLTVSGITAANKIYDGTNLAAINQANAVLAGLIAGDQVTLLSAGTFDTADIGVNKTVHLTNTYGGADLGNYMIVDQSTTTASITSVASATPVVSPLPDQSILNAITQVQSAVLPPQASAQPNLLPGSTTLAAGEDNENQQLRTSSMFVPIGFGQSAPRLQIQNGGMQLPLVATSITE